MAKIAMFSAVLALLNDDDERYQSPPDWEKDAYWHFFGGEHHFRLPKPFEIGISAGTIPERMMHTWIYHRTP
ncbi:LPD38 domain-containing protein [Microbulbifer sp. TYP-18]|uniref:LPD38 domain-containing protein n=1 Tax=Microbulbifer sp. TYP-18 TaxID=3230024 RepID=UPI0034C632F0